MRVALYPERPTPSLAEALEAAGYRGVPTADAAAVADLEPAAGWAAIVVELGADPAPALAFARRARGEAGAPVLLVVTRPILESLPPDSCDDFVVAPVEPQELAFRLRRLGKDVEAGEGAERLAFKDLELNLATYQARLGGIPLDLTYMEYELLRFFAAHPSRVWSREQLLSRVWGYDYFGGARTVDVHVRRLRAKLGETRASWITTVRSVGYRFG